MQALAPGGGNDIVSQGGTGALNCYTSAIAAAAAAPTMGQGNFIHLDVNGDGVTSPSNGLAGGAEMTPAADANNSDVEVVERSMVASNSTALGKREIC